MRAVGQLFRIREEFLNSRQHFARLASLELLAAMLVQKLIQQAYNTTYIIPNIYLFIIQFLF